MKEAYVMLYSVGLPTGMEGLIYPLPFADIHQIVELAQRAEALGYHSVWGNDHMTTQHYVSEEFRSPPRFYEPLVTYAYLAAVTTRLNFGTGLLVLPMRRDIVVTAKQIATIDHLSGGRLQIGVGVGAYREEFEALHPDVKAHRGEMVAEGIQAMQMLFTEPRASFQGQYFKYKDVEFSPKPYQQRLPILLGGNNINAVERAAAFGDGWIPAGIRFDQLRDGARRLAELAQANGRSIADLQVAPQYICRIGHTREDALREFRNSQMFRHLVSLARSTLKDQGDATYEDINLIGDADDIVEKIARAREAGATHMLGTLFAAHSVKDLMEQMEMFAHAISKAN
jgi:probable F420-dependent oxidoreductase